MSALGAKVGGPLPQISRTQLETLIANLEVRFVKLSECVVYPGWRLVLAGTDAPSIHYLVSGSGYIVPNNLAPIELCTHTLVILPRNTSFSLEGVEASTHPDASRTVEGEIRNATPGAVRRFVAGTEGDQLILICGYFHALYGQSIGLFEALNVPIVERFSDEDHLDQKLKETINELVAQEVGSGAMTAGLLKLVLISLLRRSLVSQQIWMERFPSLSDPRISRAFTDMAARPSAAHTVLSLSKAAGLSRSTFMVRFAQTFGKSPMAVLRQLRMRHAAALLATQLLSIDQIARSAGYASRSTFSKAFRKEYGLDPTEYRRRHEIDGGDGYDQGVQEAGGPV